MNHRGFQGKTGPRPLEKRKKKVAAVNTPQLPPQPELQDPQLGANGPSHLYHNLAPGSAALDEARNSPAGPSSRDRRSGSLLPSGNVPAPALETDRLPFSTVIPSELLDSAQLATHLCPSPLLPALGSPGQSARPLPNDICRHDGIAHYPDDGGNQPVAESPPNIAALTIQQGDVMKAGLDAQTSEHSDEDTDRSVGEESDVSRGKDTRDRRFKSRWYSRGQNIPGLRRTEDRVKLDAVMRVRLVSNDGDASGHNTSEANKVRDPENGDNVDEERGASEPEEAEEQSQEHQKEKGHAQGMDLDDVSSLSDHGPAHRTRSKKDLRSVPILAVAARLWNGSSSEDGDSSEEEDLIGDSELALPPKRGRLRRADSGTKAQEGDHDNHVSDAFPQHDDAVSQWPRHGDVNSADGDDDALEEDHNHGENPQTPRRSATRSANNSRKAHTSRNTRKVINYYRPPQTGAGFAYRAIRFDAQPARKGHKKLTLGIIAMQPAAARQPDTATPTKEAGRSGSHGQVQSAGQDETDPIDDESYNDQSSVPLHSPSVGDFELEEEHEEDSLRLSSKTSRMIPLRDLKLRADAVRIEERGPETVRKKELEPPRIKKKAQQTSKRGKKQELRNEGRPEGHVPLATVPITQ